MTRVRCNLSTTTLRRDPRAHRGGRPRATPAPQSCPSLSLYYVHCQPEERGFSARQFGRRPAADVRLSTMPRCELRGAISAAVRYMDDIPGVGVGWHSNTATRTSAMNPGIGQHVPALPRGADGVWTSLKYSSYGVRTQANGRAVSTALWVYQRVPNVTKNPLRSGR
jgi:hypothetical protein